MQHAPRPQTQAGNSGSSKQFQPSNRQREGEKSVNYQHTIPSSFLEGCGIYNDCIEENYGGYYVIDTKFVLSLNFILFVLDILTNAMFMYHVYNHCLQLFFSISLLNMVIPYLVGWILMLQLMSVKNFRIFFNQNSNYTFSVPFLAIIIWIKNEYLDLFEHRNTNRGTISLKSKLLLVCKHCKIVLKWWCELMQIMVQCMSLVISRENITSTLLGITISAAYTFFLQFRLSQGPMSFPDESFFESIGKLGKYLRQQQRKEKNL